MVGGMALNTFGQSADSAGGPGRHRFVVVASRLPVDRTEGPDGEAEWRPSPGGLVSALEPVMRKAAGRVDRLVG